MSDIENNREKEEQFIRKIQSKCSERAGGATFIATCVLTLIASFVPHADPGNLVFSVGVLLSVIAAFVVYL